MDDREKIDALERAFARGDYGTVTKDVRSLLESKDDDVRARAKKLLARTKPDPIASVLFIIAALLLLALFVYFETRPEAKGLK